MAIACKIVYDRTLEETFMNELEARIWRILGHRQTAALATITATGAPWVRYVTIEADPNFTLRFCTSRSSRKTGEIAANPDVHVACGNLQPPDDSAFLQIAGRAEICREGKIKAGYWKEEWRRYFKGPDDPDYVMVFVRPTRIEYNGPGSFLAEVWESKYQG
ncbi:MAG: pyridoxamine 5'-phosphate oxidase family protein [Candidatus Aminicenantes bacterium]|nr:pyridoxamine 5'-phosphate oxidase family protein [Candidatus Aminicenantes bacterium]